MSGHLDGRTFLTAALGHVDCQAQAIGSYGYGALSDPSSATSIALTGLLTVFTALYGMRLLLGYSATRRDLIDDIIRVGIVLTLATSWPAWRTVGYDLVIHGPDEIARAIGGAVDLPGSRGDLAGRLQRVDDAILALNERGSGRRGVANGDWFQLGFARIAFLTGTLGPLALVRLAAGILLAIAPLVAGLLLFGVTRSIFAGWAKGLVAAFLAMMTLSLILSVELAMVEPWLRQVLRLRFANEQALSAPTEILIITHVLHADMFSMIALATRIAFNPAAWAAVFNHAADRHDGRNAIDRSIPAAAPAADDTPGRAREVASAVAQSVIREERLDRGPPGTDPGLAAGAPAPVLGQDRAAEQGIASQSLGSSFRRTNRRVSAAAARRDFTG